MNCLPKALSKFDFPTRAWPDISIYVDDKNFVRKAYFFKMNSIQKYFLLGRYFSRAFVCFGGDRENNIPRKC